MNDNNQASTRRIFFWLFLVVFLWIAITYFAKTERILEVLSSGRWYWIILAVICQAAYYPVYTFFVQRVFCCFDVNLSFRNILPVYVASKFTDVALPIATLGEVAIFVRNGKKLNISPLNIGIAISFVLFFEVLSFILVSLPILILLSVFNTPSTYIIVTFLLLMLAVLIAILLLISIISSKSHLNRLTLSIIKLLLRVIGKKSVEQEKIDFITNRIEKSLSDGKRSLRQILQFSISTHLLNLLTFSFVFLAFAGHFDILAILAGYMTGMLFTIVSITPQGVGVAETAMIATLHSFGLDLSVAAVITLAYRGLLYWLPLFPGFYAFSHLELKKTN